MPDKKFTTHGNEPIEARIVAWVLGEASAFEADELERLCEEQPELAVFKRRIESVHGLVEQAHDRSDDASWKLSTKKRAAIEELIGAEEEVIEDLARDQRVGQSGRRALLAIAACLVLTVVVASVMTPVMLGQKKRSSNQSTPDLAMYAEGFEDELGIESQGAHGDYSGAFMSLDADKSANLKMERVGAEYKRNSRKDSQVMKPNTLAKESVRRELLLSEVNGALTLTDESAELPSSNGLSIEGNARLQYHSKQMKKAEADPRSTTESRGKSGSGNKPADSPSVSYFDSSDIDASLQSGGAGAGGPMPTEEKNRNAPQKGESDFGYLGGKDKEHLYRGGPVPAGEPASPPVKTDPNLSSIAWQRNSQSDPFAAPPAQPETEGSVNGKVTSAAGMDRNMLAENLALENRFELTPGESNLEMKEGRLDNSIELDDGEFKNATALTYSLDKKDLKQESLEKLQQIEEVEELGKKLEDMKVKVERKRPVVTDEETVASVEPYSTFSLNINDASFRVAQAALARGEMPDPAGIKVEQFYNAVDYGDPSPPAGQPVTSEIEQTAHPIIPGRNLVRIAVKTASEGRSQGQPLRLTLLIDQSGSMSREDRRQAMVEALDGLRGLLKEHDQVNVIGFARTPRLLGEAIKGNEGRLGQLVNIEANEGGTNLEEALKLGEQLARRHQLEGAQNRMVLFTDGAANLGDADPNSLAEKIKDLRQKGIAFDVAGIVADGLNDELLGEMARHGNGRYYVVGKGEKERFAEQLAGAFRPAAENVKVQVHFNPERIGRYKLIGFEKERLNQEDFRNDAVDAAEMAAEEAGIAIYQVETLPEGDGEIGEVSVRFRDVASDQMVERSWTIAYQVATPAIDQAQPSMQLATLAMLAGEKLRGGPLAQAINFNEMGELIAQINQHFKGDLKTTEMLEMLEQLK